MRVNKEFYCMQEKKWYKIGDAYTGNRKDVLGKFVKAPEKKKRAKKQ